MGKTEGRAGRGGQRVFVAELSGVAERKQGSVSLWPPPPAHRPGSSPDWNAHKRQACLALSASLPNHSTPEGQPGVPPSGPGACVSPYRDWEADRQHPRTCSKGRGGQRAVGSPWEGSGLSISPQRGREPVGWRWKGMLAEKARALLLGSVLPALCSESWF